MHTMSTKKKTEGFTIVELLIVVIVIAILATITIIGFNGINVQAKESALKADLRSAATQLGITKQETGNYPGTASGLKKADAITFTYSTAPDRFCLQASSSDLAGTVFHVTQEGTITAGACPIVLPTGAIQNLTAAVCATMPVFNGTHPQAVATLTDSRGGITQSYEVAKLADNKCWMLTNLKLGSAASAITLTPQDSDIASDFALPAMRTHRDVVNYTPPQPYGPVPGDTGAGATHYGYLYDWNASTANTQPGGSTAATYSLCPAGWRLPAGGPSGDFQALHNVLITGGTPAPQAWSYSGAFKGILAGRYRRSGSDIYVQQSSDGIYATSTGSLSILRIANTFVQPHESDHGGIGIGLSIRCIVR